MPEQEQGSTALKAAYGGKCLDAFGKWDQGTSLLRTFQGSLLEDRLEPWSESFPPSGTMRSGTAYRLRPLVRRTSVGGGGVLPTPTTDDAFSAASTVETRILGGHQVELRHMAKTGMWPTPKAQDAKHGTLTPYELEQEGYQQRHLHAAVMWPTPKGSPEHYGQPRENDRGDLQAAVLTWPTPRASERNQGQKFWENNERCSTLTTAVTEGEGVGGQLNPRFVEYLMGLPQGWVALEPLNPESWLQWRQNRHWADGEWPGVPRVAIGVMHRVGQLRALGNGVVPAVVKRFLRNAC